MGAAMAEGVTGVAAQCCLQCCLHCCSRRQSRPFALSEHARLSPDVISEV